MNPRIGRHSFTLQRAQPPRQVNISEIKSLPNGAEIIIESSEIGELPIIQYILKYDLQDTEISQLETLIVPGNSFYLRRSFITAAFLTILLAKKSTKQKIKIANLRPSTHYQLLIFAESRAGIGQQTGPIQFRTLDKQVADFTIDDSTNRTCLNDQSCLITWNIKSDGGATIFRAEIFYAQVTKHS